MQALFSPALPLLPAPALRPAPTAYAGYLLRLSLLAGTDELLPHQRPAVYRRVRELWRRLRLEGGAALDWLALGLARVRGCAQCRQALRRQVSLFEALGPAALSWVV